MRAAKRPPGVSVFVGMRYDSRETRSLPVSYRSRMACRQTYKGEANGGVGILYRNETGRIPHRELAPPEKAISPRCHKWMESLELDGVTSGMMISTTLRKSALSH
jgi:hypothetical protein